MRAVDASERNCFSGLVEASVGKEECPLPGFRYLLRIIRCGNIEPPRAVGVRIEHRAVSVFFYEHGGVTFRIAEKADAFAAVRKNGKPFFIGGAGCKRILRTFFGADSRIGFIGFCIVKIHGSSFHRLSGGKLGNHHDGFIQRGADGNAEIGYLHG